MFAKCVSRISVALVLAAVLAVLPAAGALAAPTAPADGISSWYTTLQDRLADWAGPVLETLRLQPRPEEPGDVPVVNATPQSDDDSLLHVEAEGGYQIDPDG